MTPKKGKTGITRRRITRYVNVVFAGSTTEFARFIGVAQSTISRIVSGERQKPRVTTVQRIAKGMCAPIAWLMGDMDVYTGGATGSPEWYNMLLDHWGIVTEKDYHFLKSIEGTSDEATKLIGQGLAWAKGRTPEAVLLYAQFGPSAETGRTVQPFIDAVRTELESVRQNVRLIVTELKKRDDVCQKRP